MERVGIAFTIKIILGGALNVSDCFNFFNKILFTEERFSSASVFH